MSVGGVDDVGLLSGEATGEVEGVASGPRWGVNRIGVLEVMRNVSILGAWSWRISVKESSI